MPPPTPHIHQVPTNHEAVRGTLRFLTGATVPARNRPSPSAQSSASRNRPKRIACPPSSLPCSDCLTLQQQPLQAECLFQCRRQHFPSHRPRHLWQLRNNRLQLPQLPTPTWHSCPWVAACHRPRPRRRCQKVSDHPTSWTRQRPRTMQHCTANKCTGCHLTSA